MFQINFGLENMKLIKQTFVIILGDGEIPLNGLQKKLMSILVINTLRGIGLEKITILVQFQSLTIGGN